MQRRRTAYYQTTERWEEIGEKKLTYHQTSGWGTNGRIVRCFIFLAGEDPSAFIFVKIRLHVLSQVGGDGLFDAEKTGQSTDDPGTFILIAFCGRPVAATTIIGGVFRGVGLGTGG